jgi:hypothetical protein
MSLVSAGTQISTPMDQNDDRNVYVANTGSGNLPNYVYFSDRWSQIQKAVPRAHVAKRVPPTNGKRRLFYCLI